ncbi:excinuclease ATPase subunit [Roseateles sp. BYS78W]|uniref:Excinuclease ATPase subunit n=1 Tax=Pelomonas candidula TaxID=3299025 RepID=A0ABW7HIE9_9BURK
MKSRFAALAAVALMSSLSSGPAAARDTVLHIPLADVLAMPEAKAKLDPAFKFYLAGQATPNVSRRFSSDVSNPKTNGFGKDDNFGCKWAALSALISLQESAKRQGGNAVVDIVSYYKKVEYSNPTDFECHAGAFIIGVALKGTAAKVDE